MATDRGLGRSLADIRADLEAPGVHGSHGETHAASGGPLERLVNDVRRIAAGAEPRADEFRELTAGEAWGLLLEMPPAKRLAWLGNILEAALLCQVHEDAAELGLVVTREQIAINYGDLVSRLKRGARGD